MNLRFPGQWFQLETGLAYNWHRHYDATIGRYVQPDPLVVDDGEAKVSGLAMDVFDGIHGHDGGATAKRFGWRAAVEIATRSSARAMLRDGPSSYGYAGQNTLTNADPRGLTWSGELFRKLIPGSDSKQCLPNPRCSEEDLRDLQERVENACGTAKRCIGGDSPEIIQIKTSTAYACIAARRRINDKCYGGGDPGHIIAIEQRLQSIANCYKIGGGIPK